VEVAAVVIEADVVEVMEEIGVVEAEVMVVAAVEGIEAASVEIEEVEEAAVVGVVVPLKRSVSSGKSLCISIFYLLLP
jgi:hypothetical protein